MKYYPAATLFLAAATRQYAEAFSPLSPTTKLVVSRQQQVMSQPISNRATRLFGSLEEQTAEDTEIERLRSMAQNLRAEAASLEAERAEEIAQAAEAAFVKFDTDSSGAVTFDELKAGLEKMLKMELPEKRVRKLMEDFDTSGDGKLQPEEFVGVEKFQNRLEQLVREEKQQARAAMDAAKKESEMALLEEAKMNMLNDGEPTNQDKILSVLPYLFPLVDSLEFGRFLLTSNQENPIAILLAVFYSLFKSIPFSGFIAFLALNVLSTNTKINRLVRFNMQQAIYLDIALFFPALFGTIITGVANGAGVQFTPAFTEISSDLIFGAIILSITYASISSLLGITPNKIPFISQTTESQMPTLDWFDEEGKFVPRQLREDKDKKDEDK